MDNKQQEVHYEQQIDDGWLIDVEARLFMLPTLPGCTRACLIRMANPSLLLLPSPKKNTQSINTDSTTEEVFVESRHYPVKVARA